MYRINDGEVKPANNCNASPCSRRDAAPVRLLCIHSFVRASVSQSPLTIPARTHDWLVGWLVGWLVTVIWWAGQSAARGADSAATA